jgi:hypothetical protein
MSTLGVGQMSSIFVMVRKRLTGFIKRLSDLGVAGPYERCKVEADPFNVQIASCQCTGMEAMGEDEEFESCG